MPQSRKTQICLAQTPYYHCISRCVRRAFLCGKDIITGKSYEHRREWVEKKLLFLSEVFAIDICAHAVMQNHTHLVLHVNSLVAEQWTTKEVITRWHKIFKGNFLTKAYLANHKLTKSQTLAIEQLANQYKHRLISISWFMRVLNEGIARAANKEDGCTGRFWEGRFKSQALLDNSSLLACMAYVDLNPIRAGIAKSLQSSEYTSIRMRINSALKGAQPKGLMKFSSNNRNIDKTNQIAFKLDQYIHLLEESCKSLNQKKAFTMKELPKTIFIKFGSLENHWLKLISNFEDLFQGAVGTEVSKTKYHSRLNHKRRASISNCEQIFG